jgi:hypothetical protein
MASGSTYQRRSGPKIAWGAAARPGVGDWLVRDVVGAEPVEGLAGELSGTTHEAHMRPRTNRRARYLTFT